MDLRVVKTEKIIRESFLELRNEMPLEKIRVKDICDKALINKSTFYKHYSDVFDLSDKMEDEFISSIINIEGRDSLFRDPETFISNIDDLINGDAGSNKVLFKDRVPIFWGKISTGIIQRYRDTGGEEYATAMLFVMGGLAFTRFLFDDTEPEEREKLRQSLISYIHAIGNTMK